tara:strand:- start:497 stop:700 length:204 start_codon:yes stop_codon:yes gene_type:complete
VNVLALLDVDVDVAKAHDVLRRYVEPAGVSIVFFDNEADLKSAQERANTETIVLLSMSSAAENDRVR